MAITYTRWVPDDVGSEAMAATEAHVRAHISSMADPVDDGERYADDVQVEHRPGDRGTTVYGRLDLDAQAPYMWASFDPDAEAGSYAILAVAGAEESEGGR